MELIAHKLAWKFSHRTGLDQQDLFQEAMAAWLESESEFSQARGVKPSTFAFHVMNNHLKNYAAKERRAEAPTDEMPSGTIGNHGYFRSRLNDLSKEAYSVVKMIFECPAEYMAEFLAQPPKLARGQLKKDLRSLGWSWPCIYGAFREIQELLAEG